MNELLTNPRNTLNIRRNTRTQKLSLHQPAVLGKRLPQRNRMPSVSVGNLIHGIHEAFLFDVFHWIYPEPALILGGHNIEQRNHHDLIAVTFAEDVG